MEEHGPIFISGRFRSGTTALWQIFSELPDFVAYYEPCHDGLLNHIHHTAPSRDHRGVSDYWGAYRPIMPDIEQQFDPRFGTSQLYLESSDVHAELSSYLRMLIDRAQPHRPVLQFNRADFRLPWLTREFPEATVVHLVRNPRDTWVSSRRHLPPDQWNDPFEVDAFDLMQWCVSLAQEFPFLLDPAKDGYSRHYQLARLSEVMGRQFADLTLDFDQHLLAEGTPAGPMLVEAGVLPEAALSRVAKVIDHKQGATWSEVRPKGWFESRESSMADELASLGLLDCLGRESLAHIRNQHEAAWNSLKCGNDAATRAMLLLKLSECRSEQTRLLGEIHRQASHEEAGPEIDSSENAPPE